MLTLPIKRKWFDLIESGEKREEYRENTSYWRRRLLFGRADSEGARETGRALILRNGYRRDAPRLLIRISGVTLGPGKEAWGAEPGKSYLRLHITAVKRL